MSQSIVNAFRQRLNCHALFLIVAAFFGLIFVFGTPSLWGNDETTHFPRVYQLSEGHMTEKYLGTTPNTGYGGYVPANIYNLLETTESNLAALQQLTYAPPIGVGQTHGLGVGAQYLRQNPSKKQTLYSFPGAAPYSLAAYLPAVVGVFIARVADLNIAWIIWFGRLFSLAFYIGCVYLALRALQFTSTKWVIFSIALLPMALYQASVITADTMTNAVAILFSALFIKAVFYKRRLTEFELVALLASVLLLPLIKPAYVLLAFLVLLVPTEQLSAVKWSKWLRVGALVIGVAGFLYWEHITPGVSRGIGVVRGSLSQNVNPSKQAHWVMHHPFTFIVIMGRSFLLYGNTYLFEFVGYLGNNYILSPAIALLSSLFALALSFLVIDTWKIGKAKLLTIWSVVVVSVASVFATLYVTFTTVTYPVVIGIQGRYFIPFAPLIITGLKPLLAGKVKLDLGSKSKYHNFVFVICILVITSLAFSTIKWLYVTRG